MTTVDDSDKRLEYTGDWFVDTVGDELESTSHGSTAIGSFLTFRFNGIDLPIELSTRSRTDRLDCRHLRGCPWYSGTN